MQKVAGARAAVLALSAAALAHCASYPSLPFSDARRDHGVSNVADKLDTNNTLGAGAYVSKDQKVILLNFTLTGDNKVYTISASSKSMIYEVDFEDGDGAGGVGAFRLVITDPSGKQTELPGVLPLEYKLGDRVGMQFGWLEGDKDMVRISLVLNDFTKKTDIFVSRFEDFSPGFISSGVFVVDIKGVIGTLRPPLGK
jgi:hypothetical protein